jgi:hypothetical protein
MSMKLRFLGASSYPLNSFVTLDQGSVPGIHIPVGQKSLLRIRAFLLKHVRELPRAPGVFCGVSAIDIAPLGHVVICKCNFLHCVVAILESRSPVNRLSFFDFC